MIYIFNMKRFFIFLATLIIIFTLVFKSPFFKNIPKNTKIAIPTPQSEKNVVYEESVITKVVADSLPSVVTVGISTSIKTQDFFQINPFDPFGSIQQIPGQTKKIEQNIGSGFVISKDGLIITNKHVVSDTDATYKVLTNNKKTYTVEKIYRDPLNDLAILKVNAANLKPLTLGDSTKLKLGQLTIAIGTPLGEFTNTVTQGIVSGLGRGITAGSAFEGYVEKLDNIIQTDAAINPGNSGGPLLNSSGEVIGINTAVAQGGQNIGFAIPSSIIKELVDSFNKNGATFEKPFLGIRYKMIDRQTAVLNDLVQGAYIVQVVENSPAEKAGLREEDIITEFDGQKIAGNDEQELAKLILEKKVGDSAKIKIWRNNKFIDISVILISSNN